ncbi:hypothetical protein M8J77_019224 [Diaphorina citri]|nr:hypothetical protein M8J77_019224 [Diaphorina citri]
MYDGITSKVKTPVGLTSSFRINSGLKQGGVLSPLLFIMTMNEIQREVKDQMGENNMNIMLFADDICIWGDSAEAVQQQIDSWVNIAEKYGLRFNEEKIEILILSREENSPTNNNIEMYGQQLQVTDKFKYLGSILSQNGKIEEEVTNRIKVAGNFYSSIRSIIWNKHVPTKCKREIYKTYYIPILTYGSETWTVRKKEESRIQAAEMKFLRSILGKTRRDRIRNDEIRRTIGVEKLQERIEHQRLRSFGHMKRMENNRLPKKFYEYQPEGKRPKGRPRMRYQDMKKRI